MRTSTAELFLGASPPSEVASLQQLFESRRGEPFGLTMALDLGAAVAERVGAVHASGRVLGAFDASRVRCNRDGRVALSKEPGVPLAPELKRGEAATVASDVYAVGHLIYQLLTGRTPAQAVAAEEVSRLREVPPPSRFNAKVDGELDAVVLAALRHEASERPASVLALQAALDGIAEELELVPEPEEIGRLVAKLLEAKPPEALPLPMPSPGAAVATSRLQTAVPREPKPLFPTLSPEPEPKDDPAISAARAASLIAEVESLLKTHPPAPVPPSLPVPAPAPLPAPQREVSPAPAQTRSVAFEREVESSISTESFFPGGVEPTRDRTPTQPTLAAQPLPEPVPPAALEAKPIATVQLIHPEPKPVEELHPAPAVAPPAARLPTPPAEPSVVVAPELADPDALLSPAVAELSGKWLASPGEHRLIEEGYDELEPVAPSSLWDSPWVLLGAVGGALLLLLVGVLAWPSSELPKPMEVEPPPARVVPHVAAPVFTAPKVATPSPAPAPKPVRAPHHVKRHHRR